MGYIYWLIGIVLAVWIIYDVWAKQKEMKESHKVLWSGLAFIMSSVTLASGVAALAYYLGVKKKQSAPKRVTRRKNGSTQVTKKKTAKKAAKKATKKKTSKKKSSRSRKK